ncbi:MAG TPA: site-specific integrase [Xanthobacteraceae bacterium]
MIVTGTDTLIPVQVAAAGEQAAIRFVEFFTANIRNPNTRAAYARAVADFFRWCEERGLRRLDMVQPVHVAGYVEDLGKTRAAPSVKQHLTAVRMLYDWLVAGRLKPTMRQVHVVGEKLFVDFAGRMEAPGQKSLTEAAGAGG